MALDFQEQQRAFATRIRQGDKAPCPDGIADTRMQIYEECFFNGINELLRNCFPIIHQILQNDEWQALVRAFYATHPATTPLFYEIPQEFLNYLLQTKPLVNSYPFLVELAHYEWMEIALETATGEAPAPVAAKIDFENTALAVSPLAEVVAYHYAVHRISPAYLPNAEDEQVTYLCVYRDADDEVKFIELNALSARLLLALKDTPQCIDAAMQIFAKTMNPSSIKQFITKNLNIVKQLVTQGVLYPVNSQQQGA